MNKELAEAIAAGQESIDQINACIATLKALDKTESEEVELDWKLSDCRTIWETITQSGITANGSPTKSVADIKTFIEKFLGDCSEKAGEGGILSIEDVEHYLKERSGDL